MTKKVDTWMPLLVDKYLGDTTLLTTEQHGAYLLLLMSMWKHDGSLPDNDQQLAQVAKLTPAKWRAMRPVLINGGLLRSEGGLVLQKRLSRELARSKAHTDAKSEAGAKGAAKRWQKDDGAGSKEHDKNDGKAIADASQSQSQTGASRSPPSATQIPESASALSSRAQVGMALNRAGINLLQLNLNDPRISALIEQGATPEEFEGVGREAVERGVSSPVGWICKAIEGRRAAAAAITLAPPASTAAAASAERVVEATQQYLASQELTPEERAVAEEARQRVMAARRRPSQEETS